MNRVNVCKKYKLDLISFDNFCKQVVENIDYTSSHVKDKESFTKMKNYVDALKELILKGDIK